ncbi:unnamed protein product [Lactuca saligna]|uniref:Uncharacterized protein n=1 Tax=Lactuca saligna TaxID=75948 RepID=A0AA35ZPI1_LACSI|nr:unnamed protein product [Lactuca saligna]
MENRWRGDDSWNKKQKSQERNRSHCIGPHMNRLTISLNVQSFYVTNFPEWVHFINLWKVCSRLGVRNVDEMVNNLRDIWFGSYKLFVSLAIIHKNDASHFPHGIPSKVVKQVSQGNSYPSVLKGPSLNHYNKAPGDEIIELHAGDFFLKKRNLLVFPRLYTFLPCLIFECYVKMKGTIVQLGDVHGDDVYKNHVCILMSYHGIIYEELKVSVDGVLFPICVKEAPRWTPSFSHIVSSSQGDEGEDNRHKLDDEISNSIQDKDDASLGPFNIYETLERMDRENVNVVKFPLKRNFSNSGCGKKTLDVTPPRVNLKIAIALSLEFSSLPVEFATLVVQSAVLPPDAIKSITSPPDLVTPIILVHHAAPLNSTCSAMVNEVPVVESHPNVTVRSSSIPLGFSGCFGRISGIDIDEDDLSHPPSYSIPCNSFGDGNKSLLEGSFNNHKFFIELNKKLEMGEAIGYNVEGCFKWLKQVVEGHGLNHNLL